MEENGKHSTNTWIDPDDASEITEELLLSGTKKIGGRAVSDDEFRKAVDEVRVGRPTLEHPKLLVSIQYDHDIIEYFRATGRGWQTRMNEVLSAYVASQYAVSQ